MLAKLFGSTARVKILKLFLLNPDTSYYMRQISRHLNLQLSAVRRELENLETLGLLESRQGEEHEEGMKDEKGNKNDRKYFQANREFILFNEIRELIIKAQVLCERDFTDKLKKLGTIKMLILSGLFINDKQAPVDMLIVGNFDTNKVAKLVKNLEEELVNEVNYAVLSEEDFQYRRQVTDVFLYSVLGGKKIVVIDESGYLNLT
ncbi:ArsR family transcriptional regulator [Candidatus Falkowbacteria bacterium]|jgi:predicted transcriptional regulator|nr:MAG: ArsR family transcriptional regulator [Candidatus Falkowbacteria bacterium]